MNAVTPPEAEAVKPSGLALLREPVPKNLIQSRAVPTRAQDDCPEEARVYCEACGGLHHPEVRHVEFVGHAATTHRLLDADVQWNWEPLGLTAQGLPAFDDKGGLWIRLTVCGVSRLGYGHAELKVGMEPGAREKEVIGDAIRNAAMRFGFALDLWSKTPLHGDGSGESAEQREAKRRGWINEQLRLIASAKTAGELKRVLADAMKRCQENEDWDAETELRTAANAKTTKGS